MSFDRAALTRAITAHGPTIRVVIADHRGSTPRERGVAMLIWRGGQEGTIGGGALEFEAARRAQAMLDGARDWEVWSLPLGPSLGQCCGGAVVLLAERFTETPSPQALPLARPVTARNDAGAAGLPDAMPGPVADAVTEMRRGAVQARYVDGWLIEPAAAASQPVWIWGAGHVGRALVSVLAPLPDLAITWIDTAPDRFPAAAPAAVTCLPTPEPAAAMGLAPPQAAHIILTYSHELDLALCHAALSHGFAQCGLIGSATKWARFRSRLAALGHRDAEILRITCPIGDPALGKHPQAIAIGTATALLRLIEPGPATQKVRAEGTVA